MRNHILLMFSALFALTLPLCADDFVPEKSVFPISDFKPSIKYLAPITFKFGTGFCLDPGCRFVGTNYHVAAVMGNHVRIKGVSSVHLYLASGPQDHGAEEVRLLSGTAMRFNPAHDLAIYEMKRPLKGYHGIGFQTDEPNDGSNVDIYAFPLNWNPKRGLVRWRGTLLGKSKNGLLMFSYVGQNVVGGSSGGIVVDSKGNKIIGILTGIAEGKDHVAVAVPVDQLSEFVARAQPYLQASLFPKSIGVSPVGRDLYPPYILHTATNLSQRVEDPIEVVNLRERAQRLADSIQNFTATQTFAWGHEDGEAVWADEFETQVVDGAQHWRRHGSKKFLDIVPFPMLDGAVTPGGEWNFLPRMVGTELNLNVRQAPDAMVGGQRVHVFQYAAKAEDEVCRFQTIMFYGFFMRRTTKYYDCHGEVWADDSGTILRISESLGLTGPWYGLQVVVTYGWIEKDQKQYLVPLTITTQAEHNKTYWCRGLFTDYEMFGVKSRMVLQAQREPSQDSGAGAQ